MDKMSRIFNELVLMAKMHQSYIQDEKNKILREWGISRAYPRKKKKAFRKKLNLDWKLISLMDFI